MKRPIILFLLMFSNASLSADVSPYKDGQIVTDAQAKELQKRYKNREIQAWKVPKNAEDVHKEKNANVIQYGITVLGKTAQTIGPTVADKSKRLSGNHLNCTSCHLKGGSTLPGTQYDAIPFTNVANDYPQFRKRGMSIVTAAARVNGCMQRSMGDGKKLPTDSAEMQGILAYFDWLAKNSKKDMGMFGTGLPNVELPNRQANVSEGKKIFMTSCMSCHGDQGLGVKAGDFGKTGNYTFPPLAGDDSFNDGAGMSRLINASKFIHFNMPLGTTSNKPTLTIDQAYDVAAYVLSLPRAHKKGRADDFPDKNFRPIDYPVPEYFGDDKAALKKSKLGPYLK